jgi:hypothetical protein
MLIRILRHVVQVFSLPEMERWLKVVLGTVFSSIGAVVFFFIYDQLLIYYRKRRHDVQEDKPVMHMQQVLRNGEEQFLLLR